MKKNKKPKKTFDVLFKNICSEENKGDALEPVTANDVWNFFHEQCQTSRDGGGTMKTRNVLRLISIVDLIAFTKRVNASEKQVQNMYTTCHYAYTVTKTPLGRHLLK